VGAAGGACGHLFYWIKGKNGLGKMDILCGNTFDFFAVRF